MYLERSDGCRLQYYAGHESLNAGEIGKSNLSCTAFAKLSVWHESVIRGMDLALAGVAIIFFLPLMFLTALTLFLFDPGPVFFNQHRLGKDGRLFRCYKFRTMIVDAEARLQHLLEVDAEAREEWEKSRKLRNDPRTTWIGDFLRKSSLDELPQLFNVLRGDMSLVGPRPIVLDEVGRYRRYFHEYCSVRPGITGLWQVSGRNHVSYRRRVAMDVCFVRSRSFWLHLKLLAATVPSVGLGKGAF